LAIKYDRWKEPTGKRVFKSTGQDLPDWATGMDTPSSRKEEAYWRIAKEIESTLGPEGGTLSEIYHEITGPYGLSLHDTRYLLKEAIKEGYIR
jgi:hypothetical protein